jgi:hypothetical protein
MPKKPQQVKWMLPEAPSRRGSSDHRVGLLNKSEDFQAVLMASMGLSDAAISGATGLTGGQISYRLRKAKDVLNAPNLTRRAFRSGESPIARTMVNKVAGVVKDKLTSTLRALPDSVAYGGKDDIIPEAGGRNGHRAAR